MRARRILLTGSAAESQGWSRSLKRATGRAFEGLSRAYLDHRWLQACVDGLGVLLLVLTVEVLAGYPAALRIAYVAPVYVACLRGYRPAEWFVMAVVVVVSAQVDAFADKAPAELGLVNLALRAGVFLALGQAIHGVQNQLRSAYHRATHDQLTGVYNRMAVDNSISEAVKSHYLTGEPVVVAMMDCDGFKALNDTFGHDHGDLILRTLVEQLKRTMPVDAIIGRNGGDEFAVVFRNHDRISAERFLRQAADRFEDATFALGTRSEITYGLAVCGEDGHDVPSLARAADQNMYCRKTLKSMALIEAPVGAA